MDTDMYCVLCGNPFELEQGVHNINPEKETFQWLYDIRMLGTPSALRNHCMTTAGELHINLSDDPDIFLSETTRWTATDADCLRLGDTFFNVLIDDADGNVVFPLHHACIQIGCRVQRWYDPNQACEDASSALTRLYHLLRRQYQSTEHGEEPGVFALRAYPRNLGPRSILELDELGWWSGAYERFFSDPLNIAGLTSSATSLLQPVASGMQSTPAINASPQQPKGLEALPCELLERITECLPPRSIMSLRQASRSLALKLPLDDRFWRRHLCNGSLLPYLWDLDEAQMKQLTQHTPPELLRDWRSLARLLRIEECLKWCENPQSGDIPPGLWNRCRIWSIVEGAGAQRCTKAQSLVATSRLHLQDRSTKSKRDRLKTFGFGVLATLIVLVVASDLHSLGLLRPLSNVLLGGR